MIPRPPSALSSAWVFLLRRGAGDIGLGELAARIKQVHIIEGGTRHGHRGHGDPGGFQSGKDDGDRDGTLLGLGAQLVVLHGHFADARQGAQGVAHLCLDTGVGQFQQQASPRISLFRASGVPRATTLP
jgi:hypothetical protein